MSIAAQGNYALRRTGSSDPAFRSLVAALDKHLANRNGKDHAFFAQYNKLDDIKHAVVVSDGKEHVGCGAFEAFGSDAVEIKRMFVPPAHRQKGIATMVLSELEHWAHEQGYKRCTLETGEKQPEAIALNTRRGYRVVPNYGPYIGVESSLCFKKRM